MPGRDRAAAKRLYVAFTNRGGNENIARFDQLLRLGWKVLLPVTIVWLAVEGVMVYFKVGPWFG